MDEPHIYRVSRGWKTFLGLGGLLLAALFGWVMAKPWLEGRSDEFGYVVFCLVLGGGGVSAFLYCFVTAFRSRIEIFADRLHDVGVFRTDVLRFDEIRGYRVIPTEYAPTLVLESNNTSRRNIKMALLFRDKWQIVDWASERFSDLAAEESRNEVGQILSSTNLGTSEAERAERLESARRWAGIVNLCGGVVGLWGLFYPTPVDIVRGCLIAAPVAAVIVVHRFAGFIKLDSKHGDFAPSVAVAVLLPTPILVMHAFFGWDILSWRSFWFPFGVLFLLLFVILRTSAMDVRRGGLMTLTAAVFCAIYAYGAVIVVNGILGSTERESYKAIVLAKRESSEGVSSLTLAPWGTREYDAEVEVSSAVFERYEVGEEATVVVREGRLGIPWIRVR